LKKKEEENQRLKLEAENLRESLVAERKNSEQAVLESKTYEAELERRGKKQH
jgi:regulator of replication initiation timing